jgi:hypothetical protein
MTAKREDPILRSSRREAIVVFAIWAIACLYSVGYCYLFGYHRTAESIRYYAGVPDWVFLGLLAPWMLCTMLSFWISNYFMTDDDLGEEQPEEDLTAAKGVKEAGHA